MPGSQVPASRRGGLLGIVIGLHVAIGVLVLAAKTVVPQLVETPLVVDLLQPFEVPKEHLAKPLPMTRPQTLKPPTPTPLEATRSELPAAASAPVATPDAKPVASTSGAETSTAARFDADYLHNPAPLYPALSRRRGEEGKVVLRVSVTPQGTAEGVEVRTSSGSPRLDEAAATTVKNWKFIPAKRGDAPVQSWVLVPIIFKLEL